MQPCTSFCLVELNFNIFFSECLVCCAVCSIWGAAGVCWTFFMMITSFHTSSLFCLFVCFSTFQRMVRFCQKLSWGKVRIFTHSGNAEDSVLVLSPDWLTVEGSINLGQDWKICLWLAKALRTHSEVCEFLA